MNIYSLISKSKLLNDLCDLCDITAHLHLLCPASSRTSAFTRNQAAKFHIVDVLDWSINPSLMVTSRIQNVKIIQSSLTLSFFILVPKTTNLQRSSQEQHVDRKSMRIKIFIDVYSHKSHACVMFLHTVWPPVHDPQLQWFLMKMCFTKPSLRYSFQSFPQSSSQTNTSSDLS